MTERDREVLAELEFANRNLASLDQRDGWARPLDCGGGDSSDHSYRLNKLVRLGLAESRQRATLLRGSRGSKVYRVTAAGRDKVAGRSAAILDARR